MNEVQEMRKKIIETINELPEDRLVEFDALLKEIILNKSNYIGEIYREAKKKYNTTLQKLAE